MPPIDAKDVGRRYQAALAAAKSGRLTDADQMLASLEPIAAKQAEIPFQRARIASLQGNLELAAQQIDRALSLKPDETAILTEALRIYAATDQSAKAIAIHDRVIATSPKAVKPRADKALYLQSIGDFAGAARILRKLLKSRPYDGELYRILAVGEKLRPTDPVVKAMKAAWARKDLPDPARMHLGFALAKAHEDAKIHDKVFFYLNRANSIQATLYPHDPNARQAEVDAVLAKQNGPLSVRSCNVDRPHPVFITGMPRSGTTLVEQIIGSHSGVAAGGEMSIALRRANARFGTNLQQFNPLNQEALADYARDYMADAATISSQATQAFTDKAIQSHLIIGLLYQAIPNARFIVVHRDPRAVAFSVYKNFFAPGTHRYANDLGHIAKYIRTFRQAVDFWRGRMPDRFHEVSYEELTADPETQSRALIAAAGLEWEDQCLEFHRSKSTVSTLSIQQVRQPIYTSSREAWKAYEADMKPFFDAWEVE